MSFLAKLFGMASSSSSAALPALSSAASSASGSVARERLSLIIASQRGSSMLENVNMNKLQSDVMEIVRQHIKVAEGRPISFNIKQTGDVNLFEMQIEINERA